MRRIAKFEKVSYEQFKDDWLKIFDSDTHPVDEKFIKDTYYPIELPKRATSGSAGYDFKTPISIILNPGESIKFPTGIRCKMEPGWVLQIFPRSSLGFKYRFQLDNTVGIIDSDYYNAENEGHIMMKFTNNGNTKIGLPCWSKIAQGIFMEYGIAVDDETTDVRTGGLGSTGV